MSNTYIKDPAAILAYGFDWSAWLDGDDHVTVSTWAIDGASGLAQVSAAIDGGQRTRVTLSGGTESATLYRVTNTIETANGLKDRRSLYIRVAAR